MGDRFDPTGLFGSRDCLGRAPPSPSAALLCELLQSEQNTPVLEQGCADEATSSRPRDHRSEACPRRPASSLRSHLISDRDRVMKQTLNSTRTCKRAIGDLRLHKEENDAGGSRGNNQ